MMLWTTDHTRIWRFKFRVLVTQSTMASTPTVAGPLIHTLAGNGPIPRLAECGVGFSRTRLAIPTRIATGVPLAIISDNKEHG